MLDKHRHKDAARGKTMKGKSEDAMSMFAAFGGSLTDDEKREIKRRIMERIEQDDTRRHM